MIFFRISYVADEFHKSQVQHNSLTRINVADESGEILNDVSDEFKLASSWSLNKLALAKSFSIRMLRKFYVHLSKIKPTVHTKVFLGFFVVIMYISGQSLEQK